MEFASSDPCSKLRDNCNFDGCGKAVSYIRWSPLSEAYPDVHIYWRTVFSADSYLEQEGLIHSKHVSSFDRILFMANLQSSIVATNLKKI